MRRALLVLAVIIALLGAARGGYEVGRADASDFWFSRVESAKQDLQLGTYHIALTNARACVLAMDSGIMRVLAEPTPKTVLEFRARGSACEKHWKLATTYLPPGDEAKAQHLAHARGRYYEWAEQLNFMLKAQIHMLNALNTGEQQQAEALYLQLLGERTECKKFRDYIEQKIVEAWD